MDAVLTGIFRMALDLLVELGERVGLGKLQARIFFDARNDVGGRQRQQRAAAMIGGFELVTVSGDTRQHLLGGAFALAKSGGSECAPRDHTGKKMPWLRVKPDLERDVVDAC